MGFSWAKVHGSDFLIMGSEDKCYQSAILERWDIDHGGVANLSWAGWVICKERSYYRDSLMILLQMS